MKLFVYRRSKTKLDGKYILDLLLESPEIPQVPSPYLNQPLITLVSGIANGPKLTLRTIYRIFLPTGEALFVGEDINEPIASF